MARSEPLERMVNGPMRESLENKIYIEDTSFVCFYSLLEFIYTENVDALT